MTVMGDLNNISSLKPHMVMAVFNWLQENARDISLMFDTSYKDVMIETSIDSKTIPIKLGELGMMYTGTHLQQEPFNDGTNTPCLKLDISEDIVSGFTTTNDGFSFVCNIQSKAVAVFVPFEAVVRLECPSLLLDKWFTINANHGFDYPTEKTDEHKPVTKHPHLVRVK